MTSKWGFVSKQLSAVDANKTVAEATTELLRVFYDLVERYEMTDDEQRVILGYVQKLSQAHALSTPQEDEKWGPVVPGEYNVGDTARVRADAYSGVHGLRHNGKRGRIVGVHQSKTIMLYDDAS